MSKGSKKRSAPAQASQRDAGLSIAFWSLLAVASLLPLATSNFTGFGAVRPFTANQVDLIKLLVLQVGLVVGYVGWAIHLLGPKPSLRTTPAQWVLLAALALTLMSSLLGVDVSASLLGRDPRYAGFITLAGYLALFFLASQVLRTRAEKRQLALAVTASASLIALYAVFQYLGLDPADWGVLAASATRASSTFGNPLPLGAFLVGSLSLAAVLALSEERQALRLALWASFVVQCVALTTTFTRGAWLGGLAALGIVAFAAFRQNLRPLRVDWAAFGVAVAGIAAVVLFSLSSGAADTNVAARVGETINIEAGSSGERLLVWRTAGAAISERPLQGWGPEGFRWAYARLRPTEAVALNGPVALADDAHNYVLTLAATLGVPGMLATLGLLLYVVWLALPLAFRPRPDEAQLPIQAGYMAAVSGMLVCLMTGISTSLVVALLWLFAGALVPTAPASGSRSVFVGRIVASVVTLACVVGLVFVVGFVRADSLFVQGRTSTDLNERLRLYEAASAAAPHSDGYAQALGNTYITAAEEAITRARQMDAQGQDPTAAVEAAGDFIAKGVAALTRATQVTAVEPTNYVDLARLQYLAGTNLDQGALAQAESSIGEALERSPKAPHARAMSARILLAQGRAEEALSEAEQAVSIYRDATTLSTLAQVRLASGDKAGAIEVLEEAQKLAPGDAAIAEQLAAAKAAK